jgi:hypothetical protein
MATYTEQIVSSECIGDSLTKINNNFANLDEAIKTLNNTVKGLNKSLNAVIADNEDDLEPSDLEEINNEIDELSKTTDQFVTLNQVNQQANTASKAASKLEERFKKYINKAVAVPTYYKESTFVYGKPKENIKVSGLTDKWANVFTNPDKDPLEVTFKTTKNRQKALVLAGVYVSLADRYSTMWTRVWNETDDLTVVTGSQEGHVDYSEGNTIVMQKVVDLKPQKNYTFRVQTYIPSLPGSVMINGFHLPNQYAYNLNPNTNNYNKVYAQDPPKNNTTGINLAGNSGVKNVSYIQILLI